MAQLSRRNFVQVAATMTGAAMLAACGNTSVGSGEETGTEEPVESTEPGEDVYAAPDASAYPIEPDGDGVEALFSLEELRDGWTRATNPNGIEVGAANAAKIIQVSGLAFRDMDGSGKLDLWEDWRQTAEVRAEALVQALGADECVQLMWHGGAAGNQLSTDTANFGLLEEGSRAGVSRLRSTISSYAADIQWINQVQQICEDSERGIPYLNSSDPYVLFNVPAGVGLAAAMDKDVWRKAGMWQARAWRATGVRIELGPQVDVYSNPVDYRLNGSVSEDPALNRDFAAAFGGGMQSTWGDDDATDDLGWGKDSCAVMLKHYAGEGSTEGGRDDHNDQGKWNVFPGGNFDAHLIPFLDGGLNLDSKTGQMAAVMPCYGIAYDPNDPEGLGEHVGGAYSRRNIGILRNTGWDGMITSDWRAMTYAGHGVKDLTEAERYKLMVENTIDQHGGSFDPEIGMEAYQMMVDELGEDEALSIVRESARRILKVMLDVQLFDQPYCDRTAAKEILESEAAAAFGMDAANRSVIMLKNDGVISGDGLSGKVYIPTRMVEGATALSKTFGEGVVEDLFDVVTDEVGEPTGDPAEDTEDKTFQASDLTRLTSDDLADVSYAIFGLTNPTDAYQGFEGGKTFFGQVRGTEETDEVTYKPITLQYRPYTANGDEVRRESLNPTDEFGVSENRSVFGESSHATNEADLDAVIALREALPEGAKLILVIKADRPMCFHEIEPYADAILFSFGNTTDKAFANILSGAFEPSGLLPFQLPKDMTTVMEQLEDVPRDMECYEDAMGNTYDFCFGMNWSGVIDDERVATYRVPALTQPECEVIPGV